MKSKILKTMNGDTIIGMTNNRQIKQLGWADKASMSSWYEDDPSKNHLGLIELVSNITNHRLPILKNFFDKGAVITVNGAEGKFTYDLPIMKDGGAYTMEDTSGYAEQNGIDETVFPLKLNHPFTSGDILTYNAQYGEQVVVSSDYEVRREGDVWVHWVKLFNQDPEAFFPSDYLKEGVRYWKVDHVTGEYEERLSSIDTSNSPLSNVGTITCEFQLGGHRGTETYYSQYAGMRNINAARAESKRYWNQFMEEQKAYGQDKHGDVLDMFFVAKYDAALKKIDQSKMFIGHSLEYLNILETMKMESTGLMYTKGGMVSDVNGVKRVNEGLYHSWRRGTIIEYSNKITKNTLKKAQAIVFANRKDLLPHQKYTMFEGGYVAYTQVLELFRDHVIQQTNQLQALLGTDRVLPKSPITGKSLTALEFEPILFTKVNLPELGVVEIKHNIEFDYAPMSDIRDAGYEGLGYAHTSGTLVIKDITSKKYSNAYSNLPKGVSLINGGNAGANIYYVKPEGDNFWWGFSNGRWSPDNAQGIHSSFKRFGREFFSHVISAAWIKDLTRHVIIEKRRK